MKYHEFQRTYVAESREDFLNCAVLRIEDYKPGLKRTYIRSSSINEGRLTEVISREEYLKGIELVKE